jgi:hypothetical protein
MSRSSFYSDQEHYEHNAMAITSTAHDGDLLTALRGVSEAYQFANSRAVTGDIVSSTESVCVGCEGSCNGCFGASSGDCADCSGSLLQTGNRCSAGCDSDRFLDVYDQQCKPITCEYGDVVLTSISGAHTTSTNSWQYLEKGNIVQVSPSSGQVSTPVTIRGTRLCGGGDNVRFVRLASVLASIVSESGTEVSVVATSAAAQTGDVQLTSNSGSTVTENLGWQYLQQSNIASLFPVSGQIGTEATISGTNMLMGGSSITSVTIAGAEVESIVSYSDIEIVVVSAAGAAGAGAITLLANTGATTTSAADILHVHC